MDPQVNKPSLLSRYKFTIVSLFIILLAAVPLLVFSKRPASAPKPVAIVTPTPTLAPLTVQNAGDELDKNDQQMQQTLNQVDTDVQAAFSVDSSQDSTTGL